MDNNKPLLPVAKRIAAKTVGLELNFATKEEMDSAKARVKSENRDGKIDSIVNDIPYIEKKLEDDKEYKELSTKGITPLGPKVELLFMDFKYEGMEEEKEGKIPISRKS